MSRFADPRATRTVDLGPCECPGTPHERDEALIRSELSGSEIARIVSASQTDESEASAAFAPYVLSWNLLDPDGQPTEPSADLLTQLMATTLQSLVTAISEVVTASVQVPNRSSGPSRASSRGTASRIQKTPPGT